MPRSATEIFKTFLFYYMIMKYTNFQLPEVAPYGENHVLSHAYILWAKSIYKIFTPKMELFDSLFHNCSWLHQIADKILTNFHIKNFFLASTVWEWCPKQISLYLLKSDKKRLPILYEDLKGNTCMRAFLPIFTNW